MNSKVGELDVEDLSLETSDFYLRAKMANGYKSYQGENLAQKVCSGKNLYFLKGIEEVD